MVNQAAPLPRTAVSPFPGFSLDGLRGGAEAVLIPVGARGLESVRSIAEVLQDPDLEQNEGKRRVDAVDGAIRLERATHRYPGADEDALHEIDRERSDRRLAEPDPGLQGGARVEPAQLALEQDVQRALARLRARGCAALSGHPLTRPR